MCPSAARGPNARHTLFVMGAGSGYIGFGCDFALSGLQRSQKGPGRRVARERSQRGCFLKHPYDVTEGGELLCALLDRMALWQVLDNSVWESACEELKQDDSLNRPGVVGDFWPWK